MVVGGIERPADIAVQSLRQRDKAREMRQRERLVEPRSRALLQAQQRRVGADQRARPVDAATNDALVHRAPSAVRNSLWSASLTARAGSIASDASIGASAIWSSRNGANSEGSAALTAVNIASAISSSLRR